MDSNKDRNYLTQLNDPLVKSGKNPTEASLNNTERSNENNIC